MTLFASVNDAFRAQGINKIIFNKLHHIVNRVMLFPGSLAHNKSYIFFNFTIQNREEKWPRSSKLFYYYL